DLGAALTSLSLGWLLATGRLALWQIYVGTAVISAFNTFQGPAYGALMTLLVAGTNLGRANGLLQVAQGLQVMAPRLAGVLLDRVGVPGIVALDLSTFLFAWSMLLVVRIPRLPGGVARSRSLGLGWGFLKGRPELVRLLALSTSVSFANSVGAVLISPL